MRCPKKNLLRWAKSRAIRKELGFDITIDDINIPEFCPILLVPLVNNKGSSKSNSLTLDRIDPKLGYVKGNVQVISMLANLMKQDATADKLLLFANWIKENYE